MAPPPLIIQAKPNGHAFESDMEIYVCHEVQLMKTKELCFINSMFVATETDNRVKDKDMNPYSGHERE